MSTVSLLNPYVFGDSDNVTIVGSQATETDTAQPQSEGPATIKTGTLRTTNAPSVDSVHLGFRPKAIVLFCVRPVVSDTTLTTEIVSSICVSDGTTTRAVGIRDDSGVGSTSTGRSWRSTLSQVNTDGSLNSEATVTLTSVGFELNWTTLATANTVFYWAIGGENISAKVITLSRTGTGSTGYTGAGFQPKALIGLGTNTADVPSGINGSAMATVGFADDDADEASVGVQMSDNASAANTSRRHSTSHIFAMDDAAASTQELAASITTLDSDGFTLNTTTLPGTRYFAVLCLGGSAINATEIVSFTADSTTGSHTQTFSGLTFDPNGGLLLGIGGTTVAGATTARLIMGGFGDALDQASVMLNSNDTSDPTLTHEGVSNTSAFMGYTGTDAVLDAVGEITAKDSDSIDVAWDASKTADQFIWSALLFDLV